MIISIMFAAAQINWTFQLNFKYISHSNWTSSNQFHLYLKQHTSTNTTTFVFITQGRFWYE